jgi:hypothetical protein
MRKNLRQIATLGLQGSSPPPRESVPVVPDTIPAPPPVPQPLGKGPITAPIPDVEHTTVIGSLQGYLVVHVNPKAGGPPQFLGTPFKEQIDAFAGAEAEAQARKIPFIPRGKEKPEPPPEPAHIDLAEEGNPGALGPPVTLDTEYEDYGAGPSSNRAPANIPDDDLPEDS